MITLPFHATAKFIKPVSLSILCLLFLALSARQLASREQGTGLNGLWLVSFDNMLECYLAQRMPEQPTVLFCDLTHNPRQYNNQVIRTTATAITDHFENAYLFSSDCNKKESYAHFRVATDEVREAIDTALGPYRKGLVTMANVTIVGRFSSGKRYGHLDAYRHEFMIQRVESSSVVTGGTSNNDDGTKRVPQRSPANQRVKRANQLSSMVVRRRRP
jgi:hypothetical protein